MPALLFVAFIVVPIAELYVLIQVGQTIGVLPTIALLIVDSLLGAWLLRREGARGWRRFRSAVNEGRPPGREGIDGVVGLLGALLLLTPGFISDAVGLLLLAPPIRAAARAGVRRAAEARISPSVAGQVFGPRFVRAKRSQTSTPPSPPSPPPSPPPSQASSPPAAIEGEIVD